MDLLPQQQERQLDNQISPRGRARVRGRARGRGGHYVSYSYARAEVNGDDVDDRLLGRQRTVSQPHAQDLAQRQLYDPYVDGPGSSHAFHALDNQLDFTRRGSLPAQRNAGHFIPRMYVPDAFTSPAIGHPESIYSMSAAGFPVPQSAPATANPNSYAFEQPYVFGGGGYGGRRGSVQIDDTSDLPLETVFRVDPSRAPESARPPSSAVMPAPFPVKKLPRASRRRRTATTDAVVILPADPPPAPTFRDPAHAEEADPTPAIESLYLGAMQEKEALKEMDYQHSAWQLALGDPVARCVSPAMQLSLLYWFAHFGGKGKLTPTVRGAYADCAQAIHERSVRRARRFGSRNGAPLSSSSSTKA